MPIAVTTTVDDTRQAIARVQKQSVGVVPTMGALHEGHGSLIRIAREECDFVVVTIFVNPTQFGPNEDLDRYPRTWNADVKMCEAEGADLIFAPQPETIYPPGYRTYVEVHELQSVLCGASRPTHFRGVTTVVLKLLHIVQPDVCYLGQKDAQQCRVLMRMAEDLNLTVRMRICPIVREPDGLAMSSRNRYLKRNEREQAVALFHSLEEVQHRIEEGERDATNLQHLLQSRLEAVPGGRLDYAQIVDFDTLTPLSALSGTVLVAVAVYFGDTRLIDNLLLTVE